MTALTVAAVALASTAMLVTRGPESVDSSSPATSVAIAEGQFGIRTYGASIDGDIVKVDIELVNKSISDISIEVSQLSATTVSGEPLLMVASASDTRLRNGIVAAGGSLRGDVAFAVTSDEDLLLSFTSDQLASPILDIFVRPG